MKKSRSKLSHFNSSSEPLQAREKTFSKKDTIPRTASKSTRVKNNFRANKKEDFSGFSNRQNTHGTYPKISSYTLKKRTEGDSNINCQEDKKHASKSNVTYRKKNNSYHEKKRINDNSIYAKKNNFYDRKNNVSDELYREENNLYHKKNNIKNNLYYKETPNENRDFFAHKKTPVQDGNNFYPLHKNKYAEKNNPLKNKYERKNDAIENERNRKNHRTKNSFSKRKKNDTYLSNEERATKNHNLHKNDTRHTKHTLITNKTASDNALMPLNKYVAHCGICARRAAVALIKNGDVQVNGQVVTEPAHKVQPEKDSIHYQGKKITLQETLYYVLLNKPKDYITSTKDERGRKTVMDIIAAQVPAKIYPVGRLDRNTTGVLLCTNDGALASMLTHPSYEVKKIYQVQLNKALSQADLTHIAQGITLEDGLIQVDDIAYVDKTKTTLGVAIHSGRNRIVRRIFAHLGYEVIALDRVMFAGLTKKNIPRGKFRFLEEKEIRFLKHLGGTKKRKIKTAPTAH